MSDELSHCPICQNTSMRDKLLFLNTQFLQCATCGLGKTGILRSTSAWQSENNQFYNSEQSTQYIGRIHDESHAIRCLDTANWILKRASIRESGRYLDIGCSSGGMLAAFKQMGWKVFGIEPTNAVKLVPKSLSANVEQAFFGEESIEGPFDLITAYHVLEHISEPLPFLNRCFQKLSTTGTLVIEVPDFDYALALVQKLGKHAEPRLTPHLSPNFHVYHFNSQSLQSILSKAGFKIHWCGLTTPVNDRPSTATVIDENDTHSESSVPKLASASRGDRISLRKYLKGLIWRSRTIRNFSRDFVANRLKRGCNICAIAKKPSNQ